MAKTMEKSKVIPISALIPGMYIVQVSRQNGPVKVRKSGIVTSFEMVQGLTEMGVLELEVDDNQSIELDTDDTTKVKSRTRQLLESDDGNVSLDSNLSEQFNRSLFMPSVREIQSNWHYNMTKVATAFFVFFLGLGVGWFGTYGLPWLTELSHFSIVKVDNQLESKEDSNEIKNEVAQVESEDMEINLATPSIPSIELQSEKSAEASQVSQDSAELITDRDPLDVELTDEQIEQRIIRPQSSVPGTVSQELLAKFNKALADLENDQEGSGDIVEQSAPSVIRIDQLPGWALSSLPQMAFSAHMYASANEDRWVRVNDLELREGDWIDGIVQVIEITQHHVILNYEGQSFRMAALTDW